MNAITPMKTDASSEGVQYVKQTNQDFQNGMNLSAKVMKHTLIALSIGKICYSVDIMTSNVSYFTLANIT